MRFVLRGGTYDFDKDDVINCLKGKEPEPIRKYAIQVGKKEYPVKQAIKCVTKLSPADFTAHDAYRMLRKLEFGIVVYD